MGGGPEIRGAVWVSGSGRLFYWGLSVNGTPSTRFQPHKDRLRDGWRAQDTERDYIQLNMPSFMR